MRYIARRLPRVLSIVVLIALTVPAAWPGTARAYTYTIQAGVEFRSGPGTQHKILERLEQNQTLYPVSVEDGWLKARLINGLEGYVRQGAVSDLWIKVHKKERRLFVLRGTMVLKDYPVALSPANPLGDKVRQGDGGTPEGRFFICESIEKPGAARYGARSLRLSYPGAEDARRGLASGLIKPAMYKSIVQAVRSGGMPNQNTALGGSIRIHGGGSSRDWTLGCIALDDRDVEELYDLAPGKVRVEVYHSAETDVRINRAGYLNRLILAGAKAQLNSPALYTVEAAGLVPLAYPGGDIPADQAVCTDVVIRALRPAGLDLQALVHEDALLHPARYKGSIGRPNSSIDHRRTRNLQKFFSAWGRVPPNNADYQAGDLVILDTGIANGTEFDHIGIADDQKDTQDLPLVINIWTTGYQTSAMDLLGNEYPTVVGHFRMGHPFDY